MSESTFTAISTLIGTFAWITALCLIAVGFSRLLKHGNGDPQTVGALLAPPVAGLAMLALQPFFISVATTFGVNRGLRLNAGAAAADAVVTAALLNIDRLATVIGLLFFVRGVLFLARSADEKGAAGRGITMIVASVIVANPGWIQTLFGGL